MLRIFLHFVTKFAELLTKIHKFATLAFTSFTRRKKRAYETLPSSHPTQGILQTKQMATTTTVAPLDLQPQRSCTQLHQKDWQKIPHRLDRLGNLYQERFTGRTYKMKTNETTINYDVPYIFYFYWDTSDFRYWRKEGYIPTELLASSRVRELYKFIYDNRSTLFKALTKRTESHYY